MVVDGKYEIVIESPTGMQKATIEFVTRGSKLNGKMTGAMGSVDIEHGTVNSNKITWTMSGGVFEYQTFECTATIEGDSITGDAKMGHLGVAPIRGRRVAAGGIKESVLAWTDLGKPRYEAVSVEWVNALREWLTQKVKGLTLDFEFAWSSKLTDPPAHLLRGDGRSTIGYTVLVKDGELQVVDGALDDVDLIMIYPYNPTALTMYMHTDQYVEWMTRNAPKLEGKIKFEIKNQERMDRAKPLTDLLVGPGNVIRQEFYAQQTRPGEIRA